MAAMPCVMPDGQPGVRPPKRVRSSDRAHATGEPTEESSSDTSVFAAVHVAREPHYDPEQFSAAAALKKPPNLNDVMTLCNPLKVNSLLVEASLMMSPVGAQGPMCMGASVALVNMSISSL